MTLQDPSEGFTLRIGRTAEVDSSRRITSTIGVLPTRIAMGTMRIEFVLHYQTIIKDLLEVWGLPVDEPGGRLTRRIVRES